MDVACSILCFTREPFEQALRHIAELEFAKVDLAVGEGNPHLTPDQIVNDSAAVLHSIRQGPTVAFSAIMARGLGEGDQLDQRLDAIAHLGKQLAAPLIVLEAAKSGTSLDDELARLRRLVKIVSIHGAVLAVTTKTGTLTENPTVAVQLCEQVPGLTLSLDPSHLICGPHQGKPYDFVYPHVRHVLLRDSGRRLDQLQVKVGRGEIEYGRIVTSLKRFDYRGSLVVDIEDANPGDLDVEAEVRKLRLLLESLL